jgi:hypothetical protein
MTHVSARKGQAGELPRWTQYKLAYVPKGMDTYVCVFSIQLLVEKLLIVRILRPHAPHSRPVGHVLKLKLPPSSRWHCDINAATQPARIALQQCSILMGTLIVPGRRTMRLLCHLKRERIFLGRRSIIGIVLGIESLVWTRFGIYKNKIVAVILFAMCMTTTIIDKSL